MSVAQLASSIFAMKVQSGLGTAASGAGGTGIEILASEGMEKQAQTIESELFPANRMADRPRSGSVFVPGSYVTELKVGNLDIIYKGVLGSAAVASASYAEGDWGAVVISGTGTIATFASGTLITDGVRAGMTIKFTNLSVAGNNSKWVPILTVTEGVMTFPTGILIDNASDADWDAVVAKSFYTPTTYTDYYFTGEERHPGIDYSKVGTDQRINSLSLDITPNQRIRAGWTIGGRDMDVVTGVSSPHFTDPTFITGDSLILLDGGLYINGVLRTNLSGASFNLNAPVGSTPLVSVRVPLDVSLGKFKLGGQFTGVLEDGADFDLFDADTRISVLLFCAEQGTAYTTNFVSFYMGDMSIAGWKPPVGGEGDAIVTMPLYGGRDRRGTGYAPTSILVSTSAA